ncbi:UDP-4-amino-4,6-dideoxy-N-acetyl-beta-L-altrosamine N-acetyltransferase [Myroides marinus]|uniref:UDP-4-amino-4, 6-dideoxy-N-acetyl-beta-L-altrosamine N-acetyltransferase n=1 Tax=Myroides marinus TaxID=703342 RepID=UPI002575CB13|nr:UDP-4-amino-4,6-dideoxy-N-acetyl-beta-L-altrosamine N-acetyltransferase [Myroides marinus]
MNINENEYVFVNFTELTSVEKEIVLIWRNDISIRKWMYNSSEIKLEDHIRFIDSLGERKDRLYYLVKRNDVSIGVFSLLDYTGKEGEWGYYLAPEYHGSNLGVEFYYAVLSYCFTYLKLEKLIGFALLSNVGANSLNKLFGFVSQVVTKDGYDEQYNSLFLSREIWQRSIVNDKKINRLLKLTQNKV